LVPIFSHRLISAEPTGEGNPVFAVSQTDVITYGNDLAPIDGLRERKKARTR
jgi:hypothetical protein